MAALLGCLVALILNLILFFMLLGAIMSAGSTSEVPTVKNSSILKIDLSEAIGERTQEGVGADLGIPFVSMPKASLGIYDAIRAIEKAQQDPKVKKAAAMMDKVAELEKKITQMKTGQPLQTVKPSQPIITKADRLVMEMLGTMPKQEESAKTEVVEESESLQQLQEEYDNMVKDINDVLASFVPPNGSTPQEQFAFFSAQKVAIEKTRTIFDQHEEISAYWVCKAYGCTHTDPSQCSKPSKGGTWYYGKHFVTEIKTEHYTEYKYEN